MLYITQRIEAMKSKDALTNRHAKVGKRLYMHHHHHHHHLHHLYSSVWFLLQDSQGLFKPTEGNGAYFEPI